MRKLFVIIATVLLTANVFAQSPEKMSYQAVIRNANGELVKYSDVGMQISILQGASNGTAVYTETQTPTTNANGLVSIEIGTGTTSDDLSAIDWSADTYFLKTETDPTGSTSYTITGVSQLLSVPYALYAKEAGNVPDISTLASQTALEDTASNIRSAMADVSGIEINETAISTNEQAIQDTAAQIRADLTPKYYIGQLYGGGIIFWIDHTGEHGLIASLDDLDGGSGVPWSNIINVEIGETAQSMTIGKSNTVTIIAQSGHESSAAKLCNEYAGGGFTDWYLPSSREFSLLALQDILIDNILDKDEDDTTNGFSHEYVSPTYGRYWTSTEYNDIQAWKFKFYNGDVSGEEKDNELSVRAIRVF